ncbi:MAG: membrane protein insertase YidC [Holosporales bacterium]|jgi:YidC/Oxa1 family membrane protein insertase|nr:membrane protein insertase YidC [Holosporales bacterium]
MFDNNDSSKNLFIALFLFMGFMLGYQYLFEGKKSEEESHSVETVSNQQQQNIVPVPFQKQVISVDEAISRPSRLNLENDKLKASIDRQGCVIDSIILKQYKQNVKEKSHNVDIFCPKNTDNEYYYMISYIDQTSSEGIDEEAVWDRLGPDNNNGGDDSSSDNNGRIVLRTQTKNGIVIERTIIIDNGYLFNINDKLINISQKKITLTNSSDIFRKNPTISNYAVVHEGLVGINHLSNDNVDEIKYKKINGKTDIGESKWFGYTDIYWLVCHVNTATNVISYSKENGDENYKISLYSRTPISIEANSAINIDYKMFAGPKDMTILKNYNKDLSISKFEMAIDFGWFFILTKPLLYLLDQMSKWFTNMGIVILLLTLMFKLLTYPLTKKSMYSVARMKQIQPKVANIQKIYANDKQRMNMEIMSLYKKEKISPMSGCLPMLLQAPVFFCLYKVFFISIEMRHAPLFGWIRDLSSADPLYITNFFGIIDWIPPKFLQIGVWPLIMGITMLLQQKISSSNGKNNTAQKTPETKLQENMMYILPIMFTYVCASFPVGVVVYWTISNLFGIFQQQYINRSLGKKV